MLTTFVVLYLFSEDGLPLRERVELDVKSTVLSRSAVASELRFFTMRRGRETGGGMRRGAVNNASLLFPYPLAWNGQLLTHEGALLRLDSICPAWRKQGGCGGMEDFRTKARCHMISRAQYRGQYIDLLTMDNRFRQNRRLQCQLNDQGHFAGRCIVQNSPLLLLEGSSLIQTRFSLRGAAKVEPMEFQRFLRNFCPEYHFPVDILATPRLSTTSTETRQIRSELIIQNAVWASIAKLKCAVPSEGQTSNIHGSAAKHNVTT